MNRRIVLSSFSIVTALALLSTAAYAQFVAQATSTGNTFSVGSAGLEIAPDNAGVAGTFGPSILGFTGTNIFPGYNQNFPFWLKNTSSSAISLDILASLADNGSQSQALKDALQVKLSCISGGGSGTTTSAGPFSVSQWITTPDALGSLDQNDTAKCMMNVQLPTTADNSLTGTSVNFNTVFNATGATGSATPSISPTGSITPTATPSVSPTVTITPTATPTVTPTGTPTPTITPSVTP